MPALRPDKLPRKPTTAHRTLLLWMALIVMFIALYSFFTPAPDGQRRARDAWWGVVGNGLPLILMVAIAAPLIVSGRRTARFNRDVQAAGRLLAEGRVAAAAEQFEEMARRRFVSSAVKSTARHNLGTARIRQGRPDEAVALLCAIERRDWRKQKGGLPELNAWRLTEACALAGDVEAAEAWLAEAHARQGAMESPMALRMTPLVRCRQGRFDEAAAFIDDRRRRAEGSLSGEELRTLNLLRAFAESARGPYTARLGDLLPSARPLERGGHDWLATRWPELRLFLEANGFTA
jgi:hypothetical protein